MPRDYSLGYIEEVSEKPKVQGDRDYSEGFLDSLGPGEEPYIRRRREPTGQISTITGKPVMAPAEDIEEMPPAMSAHIKAGLVDDPKIKMKIYAAARFPQLKEEERLKRYGIHKGEIIYMADDGQLYYETPQTVGAKLVRFAGETVAHAPSIGLGTAGAMFGPAGAAVGAGAGEAIRKTIGAAAYGEREPAGEWAKDIGFEAAFGGGGELAGRGILKGAQRIWPTGRKLARAAGKKGFREIDVLQAERMKDLGKQYGVDLIPAQSFESAELIDKFTLLGDLPKTADVVRGLKRAQAEQVDDAVYKFLDEIAEDITAFQAGKELTGAARGAVEAAEEVRTRAVAPAYQRAYAEGKPVNIEPVLKEINQSLKTAPRRSTAERTLTRVRDMLQKEVIDPKTKKPHLVPQKDLEVLDNVKKEIDQILEGPEAASIAKDIQRRLAIIKTDLTDVMDTASPAYATARKIYGEYSPQVDAIKKGVVGQLAKIEGDKVVVASRRLFESISSSPESVKAAKAVLQKQDPEIWNLALRSYLQDTFENIKMRITGDIPNLGGWLHKKTFGNVRQRRILEAAMDRDQYLALSNFMEVMRRAGLIYGKESTTATRQVALQEMKREARAKLVRGAQAGRSLGKTFLENIDEGLFGRYQQQLADAMLSPDGIRQIAKIKQLQDRGSTQWVNELSTFMSLVVGGEMKRGVEREFRPEMVPPAMPY